MGRYKSITVLLKDALFFVACVVVPLSGLMVCALGFFFSNIKIIIIGGAMVGIPLVSLVASIYVN